MAVCKQLAGHQSDTWSDFEGPSHGEAATVGELCISGHDPSTSRLRQLVQKQVAVQLLIGIKGRDGLGNREKGRLDCVRISRLQPLENRLLQPTGILGATVL